LFSQNSTIELKIDSITVSDSTANERKYTVHYHIKNLSEKKISFLLDTSNNDTITGVQTNRMYPTLYQDDRPVKNFVFTKKYDYPSVYKFITDFRNSKNSRRRRGNKE
jgi:hypothetical protein